VQTGSCFQHMIHWQPQSSELRQHPTWEPPVALGVREVGVVAVLAAQGKAAVAGMAREAPGAWERVGAAGRTGWAVEGAAGCTALGRHGEVSWVVPQHHTAIMCAVDASLNGTHAGRLPLQLEGLRCSRVFRQDSPAWGGLSERWAGRPLADRIAGKGVEGVRQARLVSAGREGEQALQQRYQGNAGTRHG